MPNTSAERELVNGVTHYLRVPIAGLRTESNWTEHVISLLQIATPKGTPIHLVFAGHPLRSRQWPVIGHHSAEFRPFMPLPRHQAQAQKN